ncbi:MAG TPA: TonB-dependent receptor [Candidatus Marinimicrobia bacterium]|nr:TonB-dependent receptor [Candidatus Neomarinimicrobiota bacterium]
MNRWKIFGFSLVLFYYSILLGQESEFEDWLEMDLSELMNIKVTTATKRDQLIKRVPATVRIITAKQIEERAYQTLEDVLADLPGFQFRNIQGFNSYSFQRGAPSQNNLILVLIDGIQINELNSGGFYGGYQYNLQNVKQIEVVYGPSSALYGTNAISGIINIITKDAENSPRASASLAGGSFGSLFADGSYAFHSADSDLGVFLTAHYKQTEKAELGGAAGDNNWSENMENFEKVCGFDSRINYQKSHFGLTLQDKQASRTTNYKSTGTDYLDSGTNFHIRFINAYFRNLYDKKSDWSLKSSLYYRNATVMDNTIAYIRTDTLGQVGYYRPNALVGIEEQFDYQFNEDANLTAGAVMEYEKLSADFSVTHSGDPDIAPPKPAAPDFEKNRLLSLYLQSQYQFHPTAEFTGGIRLDRSTYYGTVYTPRLGIVYTRNYHTVKLLYTEAFRAPKPWDYNWGDGNLSLNPERMKSLELTTIHTPIPHLRIDLSLYKNQIYDKLTQTETKWINANRLNTTGLETGVEYSRNRTQIYFNYTFTDSRYDDGSTVPEIALHGFNIGAAYTLRHNLKLNLRANYLGRRKNPAHITTTDSDYVEPYFVLNGVINYKPLPNLELQTAVYNLLDACYYHTSNRPPERYRQAQRTIVIKIICQI